MSRKEFHLQRPSLRTFMTIIITLILMVVLLCSIGFSYVQTEKILRENSRNSITSQLNQVNSLITDQIETIDSVIPLFLSNNLIQNALEASCSREVRRGNRFQIERQMSFIYTSTPLSNKNFTDSIYILCDDSTVFHTYTSGNLEDTDSKSMELLQVIDKSEPGLMCFTLNGENGHLYFARNLFSSSTGNHMGMLVLNIDSSKLMDYCAKSIPDQWTITLYNDVLSLHSSPVEQEWMSELQNQLSLKNTQVAFQELTLSGEDYFLAARRLRELNLTSAVAAPEKLLFQDLNNTLKSYLVLLILILCSALAAAVILSRAITRPIDRMVFHINEISNGAQTTLPPMKMYREFHTWAAAFNDMLRKLDASYNDNFQKQLLLKNAEIQVLQSQINPHFIFNVLNTIAWKAQMTDNEEIYQMVVSLGELMRMDILSKDHAFITLAREMEYVRLYIYLQQMRFEDKISCTIQIAEPLLACQIPCFCIQPLVENAIVHGLEPKKGKGRLEIQVLETDEHQLEITILDDGIGFQQIPEICSIHCSSQDSHTHIGLKNLDKRLELLFGEKARLRIHSAPNICTAVSFSIPCETPNGDPGRPENLPHRKEDAP